MKYGVGFWHEDGEIPSILEQAGKLKLDFVEISLDYPWPDILSKNEISATRNKAADMRVDIAFHGPLGGILFFHPRKEMVDAAIKIHKTCLKTIADLNPLYYTFHVKTYPLELRIEGNKEIALQHCLNGLDELVETAHEMSIKLVVENSTSTEYLVPVEEIFSRKIDFNLDVGHWFAGKRGYEDLERLVNKIRGRIVLLHLHDSRFQNDLVKDHLPLGQGDIDFSRVFHILKNIEVKWINLEMHPIEPNLVTESLSKVRNLITMMKKHET